MPAPRSVLYLCERAGARILAFGTGITQVGTNYQLDVYTWDALPVGEVGDALFRSIDVSLNAAAAFILGVTPIVDGEALPEQTFSRAGVGNTVCQAFIAVRGARLAARIRTLSRSGALELSNIAYSVVPIRTIP
jgi:hypothetical protein